MAISPEDDEYDFADIFPTCKYEFDSETKNLDTEYVMDCFSISRQLHNDGENKFLKPCHKLIHYLKYIKKESRDGRHIQNCKYFSYMLKSELRNFDNSCKETKDCYNTMISAYSKDSDGIDVCKENIEEINEKTLEKFQKLNSLYDIYYEFMNAKEEDGSTKCDLGKTCSVQYYTHINICDKHSNIGFCMALDKFKDGYNAYMNNGPKCEKAPRYLYSPFGIEKRRIFFISIITIFTMSIVMFTVYKFTPVYSWLHSILRRKSYIRNDLYEESRDLKNNANMKKFNSKNSPLNIQYYSSENT
ncbi:variable surface protein Vir33, putative [Plasmodium vivax]|uniref:Variable surface protein Vir33, putative n=1 Tax=Plasmodium vivax (strain Salvador I) TaxID=126793 RepID=A5KDF6_PLAVS|nr:variable surface protein Vir33, putative [Plasmodium vivax]EDL42613.1 variable surface protein Vir33, putative [Plasmodium vivax]|eukprot:XP_001612406.1 variable surface protein Vir33 [Plasmodium vivax Sal-1]